MRVEWLLSSRMCWWLAVVDVDASERMALLFSFGRPLAMEDSLTHMTFEYITA